MADDQHSAFKRRFVWPLQAAPIYALWHLFRALPVDTASAIGGWTARRLGRLTGANKRIRRNLQLALPDLSADEHERIVRGVWDNLGRLAGEFPHSAALHRDESRVEVVGAHHAIAAKDAGNGAVFFTAHIGNWELGITVAVRNDIPWHVVYRRADNPYVTELYRRARQLVKGGLIPKGPQGARELAKLMRAKGHAAMLLDQKMNDGIPVPFFGRDAMTAPAAAQFVLKYDCPLIPVRVERLEGARFRVTVEPPMEVTRTGDREADIHKVMSDINKVIETWIRERPEQWFWLHRRWPKDLYK